MKRKLNDQDSRREVWQLWRKVAIAAMADNSEVIGAALGFVCRGDEVRYECRMDVGIGESGRSGSTTAAADGGGDGPDTSREVLKKGREEGFGVEWSG